jgi:hypothetical protein
MAINEPIPLDLKTVSTFEKKFWKMPGTALVPNNEP